jgi:serine/threonine protein kinase/TPR repeat protein
LEDLFKTGDVIKGKYEVTKVLGKGGMGYVVAAIHLELRETVAIKFPRPGLREEPEAIARFKQEARAGRRIKNRHIAQVYDVDTLDDGSSFIVMEYLTGRDLAAILEEDGPLDVKDTADLILQACEGVSAAHAEGIIHRDLKPSNLFVADDPDGTQVVKVLDFGISKWTESTDPSATESTATMGTPLYMSPEQLMSTKSVDARSDVWSLGVILYQMLTDGPPFYGATSAALVAAILNETPKKPSEARTDLPGALDDLLHDALRKDAAARIQSVEAFAARLAPFGTPASQRSYDAIRELAARRRSRPTADDPKASHAPAEAAVQNPVGAVPATEAAMVGSPVTDGGVSDASGEVAPRPMRRRPVVVLGVAAALSAVAIAAVAPRFRHEPAPVNADSPAIASVTPAATEAPAASAPGEAASGAAEPSNANPTTAVASASAEVPPVGDTRPSSHAVATGTTGTTGSGGVAAVAAPPSSISVSACAAGATKECEAACTANRPGACLKLGEALEKGVGAPQNFLRAFQLFAQGCDQQIAASCTDLGMMHTLGEGVEKRPDLGIKFLSDGCAGHDAKGCLAVSTAYRDGVGIGKDPKQAYVFAESACGLHSSEACERVALFTIGGVGVTKDVDGGLAKLDAMCTNAKRDGTVRGCETLADLYVGRATPDVPANALLHDEYNKKACAAGSKDRCDRARLEHTKDKSVSTGAYADALFQSKCDAGDMEMCWRFGGAAREEAQ